MESYFYKGIFYRCIIPFVLFLWMKSAQLLVIYLDCQGNIKSNFACSYKNYDFTFFVGFGLFWAYLLWFPALIISIVNIGIYTKKYLIEHNHKLIDFTYRDILSLSWKSFFIWAGFTSLGVSLYLLNNYPKHPTDFSGWLFLIIISSLLVPIWSLFNAKPKQFAIFLKLFTLIFLLALYGWLNANN